MSMVEQLEQRVLLAGDPGNTVGAAWNLKWINGTKVISDVVSPKDKADYVRFNLRDEAFFNLTVYKAQAKVKVALLNASGKLIEGRSVEKGKAGTIARGLEGGTYYAVVSRFKKKTTYRLAITAQVSHGTLEDGDKRYRVGLEWLDGSMSRLLSAKKPTWILIHGWGSNPDGRAIRHLADAIEADNAGDQVLMLDWSEAVATAEMVDAFVRTPDVAAFVADSMQAWGIGGLNVNVAGFSMGGYAADWIGREFAGGVDRIIAMDPATPDQPGQFLSGTDFAKHSRFSLAFHGSSYGTPDAAATADIALRVNVGPYNSTLTHSEVVNLYANMLEAANSKKPDAISRMLDLEKLSPAVAVPWRANAYAGGYDGTLAGKKIGVDWVADKLEYKNRKTKKTVVVDV